MTALSQLLSSANIDGLSARQLAINARALGYTLNHDTAARYLRGDHGRPNENTLIALAEVLPVPLEKLRKAAKLPAEVTEPYHPPAESSRLNRRQRRAIDEVIRSMLTAAPAGAATGAHGRALTPAVPGSRAARRGAAEAPPS